MKIGVDAREFVEKGKTGIRRYLENLLAPLIRKADFNLVMFVNRMDFIPENLRAPTVKMVVLPVLPTLLVDQVVLPHLARQENIDIFFSPYYKIPLSGRFKRIITVHDIMFLRQEGLNRFMRFLVTRQLRASTKKADVILVDSDFTGKDLIDFMPNLQGKIRRLYPDLGSEWLKPIEPANIIRIQKTYADGKSFLLYVGNFKPHKNVDLLVRAFAQLVKEGHANDRRLLLVGGDIRNRHRIEKLIFNYGMETRIMIHADVSDAALRLLYAATDWFVTASGYEGFGYPLLEAMASGCPVICYPCTSFPEVVGSAALKILDLTVEHISNALFQALTMHKDSRLKLAQQGKEQALRFQTGRAAEHLYEIFSAL